VLEKADEHRMRAKTQAARIAASQSADNQPVAVDSALAQWLAEVPDSV
jgi:hypothetical protein